jgi:hypothetical protein
MHEAVLLLQFCVSAVKRGMFAHCQLEFSGGHNVCSVLLCTKPR